ncbi:hypothetical protein [Paludibacterium paludis]|uniref:Uncharacterized protein n=1 Tax=Paludibacterium paludis TaxID=1225769 RepID=A0A918NZ75_9NEIS|nr:hypothetical protein [Paludibacterium paludis]GGY07915.1 hypothetical protein GCM10011289_08110 [Paludibacterium paludis]
MLVSSFLLNPSKRVVEVAALARRAGGQLVSRLVRVCMSCVRPSDDPYFAGPSKSVPTQENVRASGDSALDETGKDALLRRVMSTIGGMLRRMPDEVSLDLVRQARSMQLVRHLDGIAARRFADGWGSPAQVRVEMSDCARQLLDRDEFSDVRHHLLDPDNLFKIASSTLAAWVSDAIRSCEPDVSRHKALHESLFPVVVNKLAAEKGLSTERFEAFLAAMTARATTLHL